MKSFRFALLAVATFMPVIASAQLGVSVSIGQPGFYGRIDLGDYPQPQLIYDQPVIYRRTQTRYSPIYLRVPPGHAKNWGKHCARYNACSRPVYFVQDSWYEQTYVPAYQSRHGHGNDDHGRGDDDQGHDGGNGHGNGKGKNKEHGKG